MTYWETRKLNEHHQSLIREQRWLTTQRETQQFRAEQIEIQQNKVKNDLLVQERQKEEAKKQREIHRIIKEEQTNELQKNLNVFLNLNNEERILRQELVDK